MRTVKTAWSNQRGWAKCNKGPRWSNQDQGHKCQQEPPLGNRGAQLWPFPVLTEHFTVSTHYVMLLSGGSTWDFKTKYTRLKSRNWCHSLGSRSVIFIWKLTLYATNVTFDATMNRKQLQQRRKQQQTHFERIFVDSLFWESRPPRNYSHHCQNFVHSVQKHWESLDF